jgi:SAM-dependent methyltransferase
MGVWKQMARFIIREAQYAPIRGSVLLIGRQTVHLTPARFSELMGEEGMPIDPALPVTLDNTTRGGAGRGFINDTYLFKALGAETVSAIDLSDYEGADIVHNLDTPIPPQLEGKFDFICNGSVLDNMFNPTMGLTNISRMLAPGGRVVHFEHASNCTNGAYLQFSPNWFFDYYAVNDYADCKTYIALFHDLDAPWEFYGCLHDAEKEPRQFSSSRMAMTVALAERAPDSTWDRYPVQDQYRHGDEQRRYVKGYQRIAASTRPFMAPSSNGVLGAGPRVWQLSHRFATTIDLARQPGSMPKRIALSPLISRLPMRLLARRRGYLPLGTYY